MKDYFSWSLQNEIGFYKDTSDSQLYEHYVSVGNKYIEDYLPELKPMLDPYIEATGDLENKVLGFVKYGTQLVFFFAEYESTIIYIPKTLKVWRDGTKSKQYLYIPKFKSIKLFEDKNLSSYKDKLLMDLKKELLVVGFFYSIALRKMDKSKHIEWDIEQDRECGKVRDRLDIIVNLNLKTMGMSSLISIDEIVQELGLVILMDKDKITSNQTNKEKIVSHGFDTKISFRG